MAEEKKTQQTAEKQLAGTEITQVETIIKEEASTLSEIKELLIEIKTTLSFAVDTLVDAIPVKSSVGGVERAKKTYTPKTRVKKEVKSKK